MTDLLQGFLSGSAAWGVLLTLAAFALGALINKTTGKAIFNPLLLGSIFVIILLSVLNISYADYKVSTTATQLFVVPRSIPITLLILVVLSVFATRIFFLQYHIGSV